jgi:hypothetical protein
MTLDARQKKELQILMKSRRRAKRILAKRRSLDRERQKRLDHRERNLLLKIEYSEHLTKLTQESTLLPMLEAAAQQLGARLTQEVSYYLYYGFGMFALQQTEEVASQSELRAGYLVLRLTWERENRINEAEIRIHMNGLITFHNSWIPIFRFVWGSRPWILHRMLDSALANPRSKPLVSTSRI